MLHPRSPLFRHSSRPLTAFATVALLAACLARPGAAQEPAGWRPLPVRVAPHWPDPSFDARRQCRPGRHAARDLARYEPAIWVTRWLPGVNAAALDDADGCIHVSVAGEGTGRLAELVLRGMWVPRRAVRLELGGA